MTHKIKGEKVTLYRLRYYYLKLFETLKIKILSSISHIKDLFDSIEFYRYGFPPANERRNCTAFEVFAHIWPISNIVN